MHTQHKLIAAVSLCVAAVMPSITSAVAISSQGTWETTLQGRDLDGNAATFEAYYDTVQNITWLADVDYARTSVISGPGYMSWIDATRWAANLDPYGSGITGWRLPTTNDVGNDGATYTNLYQGVDYGVNITTQSEMSHMFYITLANKSWYDTSGGGPQPGWGLTNTGPFTFDQGLIFWSATEYAPNTNNAWLFYFNQGYQGYIDKSGPVFAWAVHDGDVYAVSAVPVPATAWLFVSGLLGLMGFTWRSPQSPQ